MEFLDIMSISHRYMEILDPSTPEKIIKLGKLLKLKKGKRVIDFFASSVVVFAAEDKETK